MSHATEDENKLLNYLKAYISKFSDPKKIELVKTIGHWNNPIVRINLHYSRNSDQLYSEVINKLGDAHGQDDLQSYLENNVDEKGSVYLRLDKQKLCLGDLFISESDAVRIVFKRKGKFVNNSERI